MKEIEANEFIEHAEVHGNIYGTSYKAVEKEIKKDFMSRLLYV